MNRTGTNAELEVEVTFNTLLRHRLCNTLAMATLELARKQVSEPALKQWHDSTKEEKPHTPARRPDANTGALSNGTGVEAVVDHVLQILAHACTVD